MPDLRLSLRRMILAKRWAFSTMRSGRRDIGLPNQSRVVVGRWRHEGASMSLEGVGLTRLVFSVAGGQRLHWLRGGRSTTETARCGSVAVVRNDPSARIDVVGRGDTLQILVPRSELSQAPSLEMSRMPTGFVSARLRSLAAQATVAMRHNDVGRLEGILCSAAPLIGMWERQQKGWLRGGLSPATLARIKAEVSVRLHADPERVPSVLDLAKRASLSVYHFIRAFKTSEGMTPYAWIADQRREMALTHLLHDSASVIDAAISAGYSSASHFIATFRQTYGVRPGSFRMPC